MILFQLLSLFTIFQLGWAQSASAVSSSSSSSSSSYSSTATPFMNGSLVGDSPSWNIYVPGYLASGYVSYSGSGVGNYKFLSQAGYVVDGDGTIISNVTLSSTSKVNLYSYSSSIKNASIENDYWLLLSVDTEAFSAGPYNSTVIITIDSKTKYTVSATVDESVLTNSIPSAYMNATLADDGSPIFDIYFPGDLQFASGVQIIPTSNYSNNFLFSSAAVDIDGVDVSSKTLLSVSSTYFTINYKAVVPDGEWLHVRLYTTVVTSGTYYLEVKFPNTAYMGFSTSTAYASIEGTTSSSSISTGTSSWLLGSTSVPCGSDSELFYFELDAEGTDVEGFNIYISSGYTFFISDSTQNVSAQILANQSLLIDDFIVGIGKNYLSLVALSSSFITATPWSIVDGYLKLYGSDFHAVPEGDDGIWVLGSINAAAKRTDMIPVKVKALGYDGNLLADYPNCSSDSSSGSSTILSSSSSAPTTNSKTATSTTESTSSSNSESPSSTEALTTSSTSVASSSTQGTTSTTTTKSSISTEVSSTLSSSASSISSTSVSCVSDSESFYLELDAEGTDVEGFNIYISSAYTFFISNSTQDVSAQILANQSLLIDGYIVGIGKNYLSLVALSSSFMTATPWSIVDGYLKLYGSDFHAVPEGDDGIWVLGSINAAAKRTDMIPVKVKALGYDGELLADFPNCSSGSSSGSSTSSTLLSSSSSTPTANSKPSTSTTDSNVASSSTQETTSTSTTKPGVSSTLSSSSTASSLALTSSSSSTSELSSKTTASSESLGSSSTRTTDHVYATGSIVNGEPSFLIHLPAYLQPWSSVEITGENNGHYEFEDYSLSADIEITGSYNSSSIELVLEKSDDENSVDITIDGVSTDESPFIFEGHIVVNNDGKVVKREVLTFDVSYTITDSADLSSATSSTSAPFLTSSASNEVSSTVSASVEISSATDSPAVFTSSSITPSSSVLSSATGLYPSVISNQSSTFIINEASTTTVVITSCSSNICESETVTTGLTVVTTSISGEVTLFTTYCPLSSTTLPPSETGIASTSTIEFTSESGSITTTPVSSTNKLDSESTGTGPVSTKESESQSDSSIVTSSVTSTTLLTETSSTLKLYDITTEYSETTVTLTITSCSSDICSTFLSSSTSTGFLTTTVTALEPLTTEGTSIVSSTSGSEASSNAVVSEFSGQANKIIGSAGLGFLLLAAFI